MAVNADLLRDRRDELDLTNAQVAKLVDISPRYAENIMQGRDQPSRRVIYRLARALTLAAEQIDPDITAGRRTPQGDPSEPPVQPKNEPQRPPQRTGDTRGPGRVQQSTESAA